jgi:DNA-directed RNA polymerase alpha subunit
MAKKSPIPAETGYPHGMGQPAYNALVHEGYPRLEDVTRLSKKQLLAIHGVGPKAVAILEEVLVAKGLSFAPEPPKKGKTAIDN